MNEIASRYAQGLYSHALDEKLVNEWQEEVKIVSRTIKENQEYLYILSSAFLSLKEKEEMIDNTFKGVHQDILSLIKLMLRNHREKYLLDTFHAFNSLCNGGRGVKEGLIYSTVKLDDKTLDKIIKKIASVEGNEIELYNIIDPTLIGGIKVVIDGHIYDGSVSSHLEKLKQDLLK